MVKDQLTTGIAKENESSRQGWGYSWVVKKTTTS